MPRPKKNLVNLKSQIPTAPVLSQPQSAASATRPVVAVKNNVLFFIEQSKASINRSCVEQVEEELKNYTDGNLFLIIHTYGGDVYSAVRIIRVLQDRFKKINVIIPDFAFSSGTIMSLGSDEIYMDRDAMLGPLDLPMEHPADGSQISSLDITNTLSNLSSICTSIATTIYAKLREDNSNFKLGKTEASKISFDTATKIISPIVSKIDPYYLQRGYRETRIALYYSIDLLTVRMMKDNFYQALDTSSALVNNYPSHGYGIFRDEAKNTLKLNVSNLENLKEWKLFEPTFNKVKDKTRYIKYLQI
ncbi:MAG: SppA protein [Candidatus Roizmanbacteria bacterium GW2011_GWA2_37_7]|uniref:SppA protein n=1 Tax=Candidatus Roizmanbacteria bacterium GW2011_GWA2_37_7 TaxID=1618481 RepID=A0A0G0H8E5_9BACT|nr:MAG: SppA protein [Candidatus Roizmanbacteria bacterium GW2011_GWA2_37_7]